MYTTPMGMFDTLYCHYPLPNPRHQDLDFQTKDLECLLDTYTITREGQLVQHADRGGWLERLDHDGEWPLHGDLRFYTSVKTEEPSWIEYVARFTHGRVEWIRPIEKVRQDPSLVRPDWLPVEPPAPEEPEETPEPEAQPQPSPSEVQEEAAPSAEEALLQSLRRDRGELEKLLSECSNHWGYEDPVYRFYHQSFKVFWLQNSTQSIVQKLQALAPDRPLNPWFAEIVQAGTGKVFKTEDNARWTEVTRPILEAFFHARFFLEMAVRYADLEMPPLALPSGYAALLYLYGLR
jgi:hypothetical protein